MASGSSSSHGAMQMASTSRTRACSPPHFNRHTRPSDDGQVELQLKVIAGGPTNRQNRANRGSPYKTGVAVLPPLVPTKMPEPVRVATTVISPAGDDAPTHSHAGVTAKTPRWRPVEPAFDSEPPDYNSIKKTNRRTNRPTGESSATSRSREVDHQHQLSTGPQHSDNDDDSDDSVFAPNRAETTQMLHTAPVTLTNGTLAISANGGISELNPTVFPTADQQAIAETEDETDEEIVQTFARAIKSIHVVIPTKSQVLLYFASAQEFRLRRIGTDLQVTDMADYPLFDVWVQMDCCRCTWVIEAYGKVVMMMHEKPSNFCCGPRRPPITIADWNGDLFGYLVPGDPFLLQNPDRQTIAKLVPHSLPTSSQSMDQITRSTSSLNNNPVMTTSAAAVNGSLAGSSSMAPETLAITGVSDVCVSTPLAPSATAANGAMNRMCWLCVMEGTGRHIVRLDGLDCIQYNKDVSFQLKLLALAGVIRLSAPWNMPKRGDSKIGGFWSFVSAVLSGCAYCLY